MFLPKMHYHGKLLCRDCAGLDSAVYTALTDIDQIRTDVERDKGVAMLSESGWGRIMFSNYQIALPELTLQQIQGGGLPVLSSPVH